MFLCFVPKYVEDVIQITNKNIRIWHSAKCSVYHVKFLPLNVKNFTENKKDCFVMINEKKPVLYIEV